MSPQSADPVASQAASEPTRAAGEELPAPVPEPTPEPVPIGASGFPLKVQAAWDETPTLRGLRLHGPAELLQQYQTPGQYLELVHAEAGSGFFALAAAPRSAQLPAGPHTELELLVRHGPGLAGVLAALQPAADAAAATSAAEASADASADAATDRLPSLSKAAVGTGAPPLLPLQTPGVRGRGFALSKLAGRDLLLVAAGSGIAPLRAVLQLLRSSRSQFGQVALYYGERTESDLAYRRELTALRDAAVTVELVLSRPPADWSGGRGYVQTELARQPPPWLGPGTVALLCGQSAMISEVTALLRQHHVPPSQILMNY